MEIQITSELATAHNKIVLAQKQVDILTQRGKSRRGPEMRYWNGELDAWTGYMNELNELRHHGPTVEISKTLLASGRGFHIPAVCDGRHIKNIPHDSIPLEIMENLTASADYSLNNPPCKRCGAIGTELHHWAPKELFEDAEQWPQDYLCPGCHDRWHKTITIPFRTLRRRENLKDVKPAA